MQNINFSLRDYPLKYMIGEKTVFTKPFSLKCFFADPFSIKIDDVKFQDPSAYFDIGSSEGFYFSSIPISEELTKIENRNGYIRYIMKTYDQCFIDLSTGFDGYMANFSSKTRSTLRRKVRKFEQISNGKIDWKIYKTPDEIIDFYCQAREVSKNTYQEKLLDAGLPDTEEFMDHLKEQAQKGNIRGYLLFFEGKPVSYLYCPIENNKFIYSHLGYLPEMANHSVGTVLQMLVLEDIFNNETADYFDFTEGQSAHKTLFSTGSIHCANIMYLKNSFSNKVYISAHHIMNGFFEGLINILDKMGIKAKLKKMIRRNA